MRSDKAVAIYPYPNVALLEKNRIAKLRQANYRCEICGEEAKQVHHKDCLKTNHDISNLMAVCIKCHKRKFHSGSYRKLVEENYPRITVRMPMDLFRWLKKHCVDIGKPMTDVIIENTEKYRRQIEK